MLIFCLLTNVTIFLIWSWIVFLSGRALLASRRQSAQVSLVVFLLAISATAVAVSAGVNIQHGVESLSLGVAGRDVEVFGVMHALLFLGVGGAILCLFTRPNILTELTRSEDMEQLLREKQQTLDHLAASAFEGIYLIDPERLVYVDVNPSGAGALQYEAGEMRNMPLEQVHPGETHLMREQFLKALASGEDVRFTIEAQQKAGGRILVELSCGIVEQNGRPLMLTLGRDLTRWQKSTRKIERLNQLYALLSLSNRAITRVHERQPLFRKICDIAVEEGGFQMAWVGEIRGQRVIPVCHSGREDGFLQDLVLTLDDSENGQGPMARAIVGKHVVFSNDIATDPDYRPWRAAAMARGIRAVAAVPVMLRGQPFGAFGIYSGQANAFDEKLADLLESLGEDISYAITHIELERERIQAQAQLNKLSQAVEQSADAVIIVSTHGLIEYVNPRFTEITGYSSEEVLGREPSLLSATESEARKYKAVLDDLAQGRNWKGDFRNRKKCGELYWSMDTISPIRDAGGRITHFVSTSEDYTDLRKAQDMIEQLAFYDPLTELPNRRLLHDRMRQSIQAARRDKSQVAVMFLDLDKFKHINDSMGHPAGDQLLKEIAQRLRSSVRTKDTVARLGGDEFTVLLTDVTELSDVILTAEKVLSQIQRPITIEGQQICITTSIGVTLFPDDGDDINDLLRNADLAMYHAKSLGRNNFQFYTDEINQKALGQLDLERQLRQAIDNASFVLHYQPQLDLVTGKIVGVEALVRWVNERGEMIPPGVFIPLAEETGLIEQIGEWVLRCAVREIKALTDEIGHAIKVAINLSAYQFRHADRLKALIRQVIRDTAIDPAMQELELTESMLVDDVPATIETLHELRALGISLAIDDFGTGYSSLNYLKRFPIDILKIDRTFVRDIETNPSDAAITAAIVALGHELNMKVLAEGVENEAQLQFLKHHHCDYYQGFFFAAPLPLEKLIRYFRRGPIGLVARDARPG